MLLLTNKQIQAVEYLIDNTTDYIGYGGSAGCFSGETLVATNSGYVQIKNIKRGDYVLSFNEKTKDLEYNLVEKKHTYHIAEPPKMIIFADNFKCTYNHELLFRGKWTKAGELRERVLEAHRKHLLHIEQRAACNKQSQRKKQVRVNETMRQWKRLFNYCIGFKWSKQICKNTQIGGTGFYSERIKFSNCKPQRFQQVKQLCGKFRVDDIRTKFTSRIQCRAFQRLDKGRKTASKLCKTWREQRNINIDGKGCGRNKGEIHSTKIYKKNACRGIWSKGMYDKRCYFTKELVAREITVCELLGSKVVVEDILVYDLTVANNHNYVVTKENIIVYNSGKSVLGCFWLLVLGRELKGAKFFIGRDSIKDTRASVLKTWGEVAAKIGFTAYKFNDIGIIFENGSEIELLDLTHYPYKDPMFDRLGSKEYTAGWIEEAQQVHPLAFEVLKTRVGRWKNEKAKSKILCTFNPRKCWVDDTFYRPFKNGTEDQTTRFVYALPTDNPYLPSDYIKRLNELKDEATKQRLLYGNFDYDDDPTALIDYSSIEAMFEREATRNGLKTITADVARFGSDKAVIMLWNGFCIEDLVTFDISSTTLIINTIRAMAQKNGVLTNRIVVDDDGVGGGVTDALRCVGFNNGGRAVNDTYANMKTECGYKLAEKIQEISIQARLPQIQKEQITQELQQLKTYDADKDNKLKILPKERIKQNIGRSPDYLDAFIMRMYFEVKKERPFTKASL